MVIFFKIFFLLWFEVIFVVNGIIIWGIIVIIFKVKFVISIYVLLIDKVFKVRMIYIVNNKNKINFFCLKMFFNGIIKRFFSVYLIWVKVVIMFMLVVEIWKLVDMFIKRVWFK